MKYCIYIISSGRADRVETYDTLRNAGYTGDIYVVVGNDDPQYGKYCQRFNVICFHKQRMKAEVDTLQSEKPDNSPVYARNIVERLADKDGLDAYIIMDDDIKNLRYRWIDGDTVRSFAITKNLDEILDSYISYMLSCDLSAISFSNVMLYIGGSKGLNRRITGNREMYQIHMRNMKFPVEWKSVVNNDAITELLQARQGRMLWSLPFIIYDSPKMNTLPGGMKSVYDSMSGFRRAFTATVALPSVCKPILSKGQWVIGRDKKSAYPLVISSRYKK